MRLYYKIWADLITGIQKNPDYEDNWKPFVMTVMTLAMTLNLALIAFPLVSIGVETMIYEVKIFNIRSLDSFSTTLVNVFLPITLINYFLIFYKKRYLKILKKYGDKKGKIFISYLSVSVFLFLSLIFYYYFTQ